MFNLYLPTIFGNPFIFILVTFKGSNVVSRRYHYNGASGGDVVGTVPASPSRPMPPCLAASPATTLPVFTILMNFQVLILFYQENNFIMF